MARRMNPLVFVVPGTPVAKARPRVVRRAGKVMTHTPKNTVDFENRVRFAARDAGARPLEGPVSIEIEARWPLPRSRYRKRGPVPVEWRTKAPDLDNVVKSVTDALNGIAYADDSQVAEIRAWKVHAAQGAPAQTVVTVSTLETLEEA